MKKNKLVTLSALALITACGLTSCGGQKTPPTKVDVYLRAQAAIKVNGGEEIKEVDFKDDECATIEVEGGVENLQYGKQDVVVYITPKPFFTFRDYDEDTWVPTGIVPVHPYVGLGSPYALYNYPLQEGVAWTFEDLTTKRGETDYLNEKYKITVKKEYFQKNLVIDYGNVSQRNNYIQAYNSSAYETMFAGGAFDTDICPALNTYYDIDNSYCSYLAASKGITVTYKFDVENELITFNGWDSETDPEPSNEEGPYEVYRHISVKAKKAGASDIPGNWDELAKYDTSIKEKNDQLFIPTVINDKLSLFFNWKLLAETTPEKDYAPLYDDMKVVFRNDQISSDPDHPYTPKTKVTVDYGDVATTNVAPFDSDNVSTDYYQHTYGGHSINQLSSFTVKAFDGLKNNTFSNISVNGSEEGPKNIHTNYGVIFKVNETIPTKIKNVTCDIVTGGTSQTVSVDFEGPKGKTYIETEWRRKYYKVDEEKLSEPHEEELFYNYSFDNNQNRLWYLVQLNRADRTAGDVMPVEYLKKGNVFYLYSNGLAPFTYTDRSGNVRFYDDCVINISAKVSE